jgi:hypothetical protein
LQTVSVSLVNISLYERNYFLADTNNALSCVVSLTDSYFYESFTHKKSRIVNPT